uniref:Putative secreted salivary gland peptide n=1 Tax=Ixodes ricinus TaxID=34613 RepID=A0A0K8RJP1_IXORI
MLLLKVILVALISKIDSGPAPSAKENEKAPLCLPQESLINNRDPNGCNYQLLPYFTEDGMGGGFLAIDCSKSCPEGTHETVVDGNSCVAKVDSLSKEEATVMLGACDKGSCKPENPPQHLTVTLMVEGEEKEE